MTKYAVWKLGQEEHTKEYVCADTHREASAKYRKAHMDISIHDVILCGGMMARDIIENRECTTINTVQGVADYSHTEVEKNGRWDNHYLASNGEYVIHEGQNHHVYLLRRS